MNFVSYSANDVAVYTFRWLACWRLQMATDWNVEKMLKNV